MKRVVSVLAVVAGALLLSMATTACNQENAGSEQPAEKSAVETTDAAEAEGETPAGEEAASEHPSEHPAEHPAAQPDAKPADPEEPTPKPEHPAEHPG
jgi:uncharacterized low-complexity protein